MGGVTTADGDLIAADQKFGGGPSVLYDAVVLLPGEDSVAALAADAAVRDFVADAYAHCKFVGHVAAAEPLLEAAGVRDLHGRRLRGRRRGRRGCVRRAVPHRALLGSRAPRDHGAPVMRGAQRGVVSSLVVVLVGATGAFGCSGDSSGSDRTTPSTTSGGDTTGSGPQSGQNPAGGEPVAGSTPANG